MSSKFDKLDLELWLATTMGPGGQFVPWQERTNAAPVPEQWVDAEVLAETIIAMRALRASLAHALERGADFRPSEGADIWMTSHTKKLLDGLWVGFGLKQGSDPSGLVVKRTAEARRKITDLKNLLESWTCTTDALFIRAIKLLYAVCRLMVEAYEELARQKLNGLGQSALAGRPPRVN